MGAQPLTNIFFYPLEIIHSKKKATEQKKRVNYYPFGLTHKGYNNIVNPSGNSVAQKFGFGGKELSKERGINWHDFGARNYDASIGRWMNIDPLAEEFYSYSPYNSMMNNPINYIDPTGMAAEWIPEVNSETGAIRYIAEKGDTAETFVDQYGKSNGIDFEDAQKLIGVADKDIVAGKTAVSGSDVKDFQGENGTGVLKLDVKSKMTTPQRRFDQLLFAVDHSRSEGQTNFRPSTYYSSTSNTDRWMGISSANWHNVSFKHNEKTVSVLTAIIRFHGDKLINNTGNLRDTNGNPDVNGVVTKNAYLTGKSIGYPVMLKMKASQAHEAYSRLNRQQKIIKNPLKIKHFKH